MATTYKTEQEDFWAGEFGDQYIGCNQDRELEIANVALFAKILERTTGRVKSFLEFGANVGMNLRAIQQLVPDADLSAIEINGKAVAQLREWGGCSRVYHGLMLEFVPDEPRDFVFTKTVLIHIHPQELPGLYGKLHAATGRYLCVAEYYNTSPTEVTYRGQRERLFKRDFAGELLARFSDLRLVDYGFVYHHDRFPQDDITWFLMEKTT